MRERGLKQAQECPHDMRRTSLPMRERGLKPNINADDIINQLVAPHAGAWVETCYPTEDGKLKGSLPMRERGLKHLFDEIHLVFSLSLPMRERGLKLGCQSI